jgi:hypothetical protein
MGRKGGKKGARIRTEFLSAEQRTEIAWNAAKARWAKAKKVGKSSVKSQAKEGV